MCRRRPPSSRTRASEPRAPGRLAALLVAALLLPQPASAEEDARAQASALFRRGSALFSKGKFEQALELLEKARRLYPSHKIEASIGYTLVELGRQPEAAQSFERFLGDPASLRNPEVVSEVMRKLTLLKRSLSRLNLSGTASGDAIRIDGAPAPVPLPTPLYLRPGEHKVVVQRGERTILEQTLSLEAGELRLLMVSDAPPRPRARPLAAARRTPLYKRWWLWTIGGVVVSAAVVGAVAATTGGSDRLPTGSLGTMDLRK